MLLQPEIWLANHLVSFERFVLFVFPYCFGNSATQNCHDFLFYERGVKELTRGQPSIAFTIWSNGRYNFGI